jgi:uncharacterized protein (TIGR03437 family)
MKIRYLLLLLLSVSGAAFCQNPTFTLGGVVNHASLSPGPVAPGQLVAIMGSNLGDPTSRSCAVAGGSLPNVCLGVSVTLNSKPCAISFVWATLLIFQAPWDLDGSTASLQVTREVGGQALKSAAVSVAVAPVAPGLYTGSGNIALGNTQVAIISAASPARPGEAITIFGTGFGVTNPPAETGKAPLGFQRIALPVAVKVGGQDATVTGAFLAPGSVGLVQLDFTVPQSAPFGNLPVVATVGGVNSQSVVLPVGIPKPAITGVSNSASGAAAIAAGSWVGIYGTNLARSSRIWRDADFAGLNLPTALDGVSVKINGKPAFVYFTSPRQINVQAPEDTAIGTIQVEVTNDGGTATATANLQTYSPAFFTFNNKYPASVHLDRSYVAPAAYFGASVASRPAKPGDIILIYGTGFGPTTPSVGAGRIFSGAPPLTDPTQLRITIGGVSARVDFAGIVSPGQYQFNVVVPDVPDGELLITATIAGVASASGLVLPVRR